MAPKTNKEVNWTKTSMLLMMTNLVNAGLLPAQAEIEWRLPAEETHPQPGQNDIIIFADHLHMGFRPPGSKFFCDILHHFNIRPQDLGPNSIMNLCQFQVFCEVYLQMEPTISFFQEFFYLNHQTEHKNGPSIELGGVTIQRRKTSAFPKVALAIHPKGWHRT